ncbi:hypothetical protein BX600DRAFT_466518 [Xylariales sp. PMI_506]|nr:hypothetical protein BX600DRAFT_466518 [Xylariales sp. PMI_506]
MLRMPETEVDEATGRGRYTDGKDRELALAKIRTVMRVFQAKGARRVVLGAWGCGAYGNPVGEIATAWRKVLLGGGSRNSRNNNNNNKNNNSSKKGNGGKKGETWDGIEEVVFAIKDPGLASGFETAFGDGLSRREVPVDDDDDNGTKKGIEDDPEALRIRELREKIEELEIRAGQAVSPHLQSGLNSVLVGLKSQLAEATEEAETGGLTGSEGEETGSEDDDSEESGDSEEEE